MEKVRLFQKMLEYLYALTPSTRKFVEEHFSKIDTDWLEHYFRTYDTNKVFKALKLKNIDLIKLLNVMKDNWNLLQRWFPGEEKFTDENSYLIVEVINIRNYVAHLNEEHYNSLTIFDKDIEKLKKFAEFLGTSLMPEKNKLYEIENDAIRHIILSTTTEQALAIENKFTVETMESIKRTKRRLESFKTAKETIDFIEDALESPKGQKIAEEVHSLGLLSFEDVAEEIRKKYYGF